MHQARLPQFSSFLLVGAAATAVQYIILVTLVSFWGTRPVTASAFGFVASALLNYHLNHSFTFRSGRTHSTALPRFAVVAATGLAINAAVMWMLNERFGAPYLASQVAATVAVIGWTYNANRKWTF